MQSLHSMQHPNGDASLAATQLGSKCQQLQILASLDLDSDQSHQHHNQQQTSDTNQVVNSSEPNMTKLDSVQHQQHQPVLSVLNPVAQHAQAPPPTIHHMGQQQQQPHLHQLQTPTSQTSRDLMQLGDDHHQQQQQQRSLDSPSSAHLQDQVLVAANNGQTRSQQRAQPIEGIVADGGGPIVQWLLDNYEIADGESLPRSTVYNHYLAHCRQLQMSSVNAASFGKLIRSVFVGLKTRRLGTRGHSKYHYFGVRAKQHVRLDWIQRELEDEHTHQDHHHGHHNNNHRHHHHHMQHEMCPDGSESDSMEGVSNGGGSVGGGSQGGSSKKFKRHMMSAAAASAGDDRQQRASSASRLMMVQQQQQQQLYGSDGHNAQADTACVQQCTAADPLGPCLHHHPELIHGDDNAMHSMYTNGYGPSGYYSPSTAHYCNDTQQQPQLPQHQQHGQAEHSDTQLARISWSNATNGCDDTLQATEDLSQFRTYLGQNLVSSSSAHFVDEIWPAVDDGTKGLDNENQHQEEWKLFEQDYKSHYHRLVAYVSELNFASVEHCLKSFWLAGQEQHPNAASCLSLSNNNEWPPQTNGTDQQQQQTNGTSATSDENLRVEQLKRLTSSPWNVECITKIDQLISSALVNQLMPDLFSSIPRPLAQQLRAFAKCYPNWLETCLKDYPSKFRSEASKTAQDFSLTLRRYVSINHLAGASRAIWTRRSVTAQMSIDLGRVDMRDIEHQVSLMIRRQQQHHHHQHQHHQHHHNQATEPLMANSELGAYGSDIRSAKATAEYDPDRAASAQQDANNENYSAPMSHHQEQVGGGDGGNPDGNAIASLAPPPQTSSAPLQPVQLVHSFLGLLEDPNAASAWPGWCRQLVETRLGGQSLDEARNFVLCWNFYNSLIMKELTLKSAPSLGSFQLIRLLFDEYIYYLTLVKLSQEQDDKQTNQLLRPSARFLDNV